MRSARLLTLLVSIAMSATVTGCSSTPDPAAAPVGQTSPSGSEAPASPGSEASGAPTSSPAASAKPSAAKTTAPPAVKPRTGKPMADNTGVPAGTALTVVSGDQTFSTPGQVITGKDFRGFVKVTTSGVIFRKCVFRG